MPAPLTCPLTTIVRVSPVGTLPTGMTPPTCQSEAGFLRATGRNGYPFRKTPGDLPLSPEKFLIPEQARPVWHQPGQGRSGEAIDDATLPPSLSQQWDPQVSIPEISHDLNPSDRRRGHHRTMSWRRLSTPSSPRIQPGHTPIRHRLLPIPSPLAFVRWECVQSSWEPLTQ